MSERSQTPATGSSSATQRRATLGSSLGTLLEFYEFAIYGTAAALVFPKLFFAGLGPAAAIYLSFGSLAVGYAARPLGGVIFGHFGDRLGRKRMLVASMVLVGTSTMLMGLLPTSAQIGSWAAIILVTLRLLQGVALGGEWGGAVLMSMEHSKPNRRGLATGLVLAGAPAGILLGNLVMAVVSGVTGDQFMVWGWRIPFLLSVIIFGLTLWMRIKMAESSEFVARVTAAPSGGTARTPFVTVLTRYPRQVVGSIVAVVGPLFTQNLVVLFSPTYATSLGHDRSQVLTAITVSNALMFFVVIGAGNLSDRIGRRSVLLAGALLGMLLAWPFFLLIEQGGGVGLALSLVGINGLVVGVMTGPMAVWIGERFPTSVRYTGTSLSFQVGTTLAGMTPIIATALLAVGGGKSVYLVIVFAALFVASAIAIVVTRGVSYGDEGFLAAAPAGAADTSPRA